MVRAASIFSSRSESSEEDGEDDELDVEDEGGDGDVRYLRPEPEGPATGDGGGEVQCEDDGEVRCEDDGEVRCKDDGEVRCKDDGGGGGAVRCEDDDDGEIRCEDDGERAGDGEGAGDGEQAGDSKRAGNGELDAKIARRRGSLFSPSLSLSSPLWEAEAMSQLKLAEDTSTFTQTSWRSQTQCQGPWGTRSPLSLSSRSRKSPNSADSRGKHFLTLMQTSQKQILHNIGQLLNIFQSFKKSLSSFQQKS